MLRFATVGDTVTCNFPPYVGIITTGSSKVLFEGRPVARVGDLALCGSQVVTLIEGDNSVLVDNRPVHRITMLNSGGGVTLG